jgi:hypothetical protein
MAKNAFLDQGYESGLVFSRFFFGGPDFHIATLRRLVTGDSRATKEALAFETANALHYGNLSPERILRELANQPRQWLSLRLGKAVNFPTLESPSLLLSSASDDKWYGPILDNDSVPRWYIRTHTVSHFFPRREEIVKAQIRWLVFAEIGQGHISLSWNNFTFAGQEKTGTQLQFPFWQHIPSFIDEIEKTVNGNWRSPNLHKLVLHDWWDRFHNNPNFSWNHLRIRAELKGVALNAHSSGASDIDVSGLGLLTKALADSAAGAIGVPLLPAQRQRLEGSIMQTMIREWGTNSYEFRLEEIPPVSSSGKTLFRAHCFFGLRPELGGQDSLQHLKCYTENGSHWGAQNFVLNNLEP